MIGQNKKDLLFVILVYNITHGGFGMKKNSINVQKLLAGALLTFDRVDHTDLNILNDFLMIENNLFASDEYIGDIDELIDVDKKGVVSLSKGLELSTQIDGEIVEEKLKKIAGPEILEFFANLNIEMVTLTKLNRVGSVMLDEMDTVLNLKQQEASEKLVDKYYALLVWNENYLDGPHLDMVISSYGKQILFEYMNKEQITNFKQQVEEAGLNSSFIGDFLRIQSLQKPTTQILSISKFKQFTEKYGEILENDARTYVKKQNKSN